MTTATTYIYLGIMGILSFSVFVFGAKNLKEIFERPPSKEQRRKQNKKIRREAKYGR